jgi:RimJ/RimL family protein N-acetyltransferase
MITLREITRDDIPAINRWRCDPVVAAGVGAPHRFVGIDVDLKWYEDYLARRGSEVRCAVCLADSGQLVGMVSLTRIDYLHRNAEYNAMVGERESQNRGIGTAATRAMP